MIVAASVGDKAPYQPGDKVIDIYVCNALIDAMINSPLHPSWINSQGIQECELLQLWGHLNNPKGQ